MLPRLDELETDLVQRRDHATANGWKGEIEGIDLTLTFLRSKRTQTERSISACPQSRIGVADHCALGVAQGPPGETPAARPRAQPAIASVDQW
jgi:hypothetical protein